MGRVMNDTYPNTVVQLPSAIVVDLPFVYRERDYSESDEIATVPVFEQDFPSAHATEKSFEAHDAYAGRDYLVFDGFYNDSFIDLEMSIQFMHRNRERLKIRPTKDGVEDDGLALLPDRIWGYVLSIHCWSKSGLDLPSQPTDLVPADLLKLDCISNPTIHSDPTNGFVGFHELVVPKGTKKMLMASGKLCLDNQDIGKPNFYEASTRKVQNLLCLLTLMLQYPLFMDRSICCY
jgi:hypothetical protein